MLTQGARANDPPATGKSKVPTAGKDAPPQAKVTSATPPQLTPGLLTFLQKRQLVTLCAPPLSDSVDLQPGLPTGTTPCVVVADFDGDGTDDVAVLIAQAKGRKRAGVLLETTAGVMQFGAGVRTRWTAIDDNGKARVARTPLDLTARASLRSLRGSTSPLIQFSPKGVVLALSGGDATIAIFSDGKRWYTCHLGF